jgi:hypothetical protein
MGELGVAAGKGDDLRPAAEDFGVLDRVATEAAYAEDPHRRPRPSAPASRSFLMPR